MSPRVVLCNFRKNFFFFILFLFFNHISITVKAHILGHALKPGSLNLRTVLQLIGPKTTRKFTVFLPNYWFPFWRCRPRSNKRTIIQYSPMCLSKVGWGSDGGAGFRNYIKSHPVIIPFFTKLPFPVQALYEEFKLKSESNIIYGR